MVRGQCTHISMDKVKHYPDWDTASTSYDPLKFMDLIVNIILEQTEDQYPFASFYEKEVAFYSLHKHKLINDQWY